MRCLPVFTKTHAAFSGYRPLQASAYSKTTHYSFIWWTKKRLLLALALINDPKIVFLDEPTTGLDPQARHNFWQLISDIKSQGKTVILTTHYMEEAELLCDELIIMDAGKILDQGSPKALLEKHFNRQRVTLNKRDIQTSQLSLSEKLIEEEDRLIILSENIESTLSSLKKQGIDLTSISIETPNLEDFIFKANRPHAASII